MKSYQSHEVVRAVKCDSVIRSEFPECKSLFTLQANDGFYYEVPADFFARGEPQLPFYIVEHGGGFRDWIPAMGFEGNYCGLQEGTDEESFLLDFGMATGFLEEGRKVCRDGWEDIFIYLVPENKYPAGGNTLGTMKGVFPDDMVPYQAYIAIKTAKNTVAPWMPSYKDLLAKDWRVLPRDAQAV